MKVLHLNNHLEWKGGIEVWLLSVLPRLEAHGMEGIVVYDRGDASLRPDARVLPGLASIRRRDDARVGRLTKEIIADTGADLLHIHGIHNLGAIRACLDSGVPTVMTGHDYRMICPASMFYYRRTEEICERTCGPGCLTTTLRKHCLTPRPGPASYYYRRARWVVKNAHRFSRLIAPSATSLERFERVGFRVTSVLPYFCPLEPLEEPRPVPDPPLLTFIGRMADYKGWRYFVEALGLLPEKWRGQMIGNFDKNVRRRVEFLAGVHGCRHRLELHAWAGRDEIVQRIRATTVLVFPSLWPETLGIVGLEAMSQGVPVVASDVGGVREWLEDGRNGYLVPPGDAQAIARNVDRIVAEGDLMRFGQRAIEKIGECFRLEPHVAELAGIYSLNESTASK